MASSIPSPFDPNRQPTHIKEEVVIHHRTPAERSVETPLGHIIFETGTQTFHFIPDSQTQRLVAAIRWLMPAVQNLMQANAIFPETAVDARRSVTFKNYFNSILKPLIQGPGKNNICELINLTSSCWHYMRQHDFQAIAKQSYCVAKKDLQDAVMENGKLSVRKLLDKLVGPQSFRYHDTVEGAMTPLANALGVPSENIHKLFFSDPQDKYMQYTANADAQLMRYTAGMGAKGSFNPKDGRFSFSAKGQAKLTLASASIEVECFMPSEEGYHAEYVVNHGRNWMLLDLGYLRVMINLACDGFVGASLLGSVSMHCTMDKNTGKLQVKGANIPAHYDENNPPNFGVKADINAFAGAEVGGSVAIACQWQNPEKAQANISEPKHKHEGWDNLASISAKGDAAAGIGLEGEFCINYNTREQKFIVQAEAGLVCGVGASGSVNVVVYKEHVQSFVEFIYHKLMRAEYYFMTIFAHEAFRMLVDIFTRFIFEAESNIVNIFEHELAGLENWWSGIALDVQNGVNLTNLYQLANNINANPERLKFTLPEVKGRFLFMLTDPKVPQAVLDDARSQVSTWDIEKQSFHDLAHWNWQDNSQVNRIVGPYYQAKMYLIETAILNILSYIQSRNEYENVITHMGLNPLQKNGVTEGEHMLYENLVNEGFDFSRLQTFKSAMAITSTNPRNRQIPDKERILIYAGKANYNEPVKPNKTVLKIINHNSTVIEELAKHAASS